MSKPKDIDIVIAAEEYAEGKPHAMAISLAFKMGIKWYQEQEDPPIGENWLRDHIRDSRKN